MQISTEAEAKIKSVIAKSNGKMPRLVLKKGGCYGTMIQLSLDTSHNTDDIIEENGIKFAISDDVKKYINSLVIEIKHGLCDEIIVKNTQQQSCRCGKSFR